MPVEFGVKLVTHHGRPMGLWCHTTPGIVARSADPTLLESTLRQCRGQNPHGEYRIEPIRA